MESSGGSQRALCHGLSSPSSGWDMPRGVQALEEALAAYLKQAWDPASPLSWVSMELRHLESAVFRGTAGIVCHAGKEPSSINCLSKGRERVVGLLSHADHWVRQPEGGEKGKILRSCCCITLD